MPIDPVVPSATTDKIVDSLTLRFDGTEEDGSALHELRAAHVAEVLQGLVGLTSDFDKAGVFDGEGPAGSEILVRPAQEGSFLIEVIRVASEVVTAANDFVTTNGALISVGGVPTLGVVLNWATKSARADVKSFERDKETGLVKVQWQDDTMDEIPVAAWEELNKRKKRRKKHLRQIMAPLSDPRVSSLDVALTPAIEGARAPEVFVLNRSDYDAVRPEDDIEEDESFFEVEAQMSAIDFDNSKKWKVKTKNEKRGAVMDDKAFLAKVGAGLAIRKDDIFTLRIRADSKTKNDSTRTTWTVVKVTSHRRAAGDNDT